MDKAQNAAGLAVKTILSAVIANISESIANNLLDINVGLSANLSSYHNSSCSSKGLTCTTNVIQASRNTAWRNVPTLFKLRLFCQDCIKNCVRNLIANLVWMSLSNTFRGKQIVFVCHELSFHAWLLCLCRIFAFFYAQPLLLYPPKTLLSRISQENCKKSTTRALFKLHS